MKSILATVAFVAMAAAPSSQACQGTSMSAALPNVEVIRSTPLETVQKTVPIAVNKDTFFCAGTSFVLIAPNINEFSRLTHPTVLRDDQVDCSKYDQPYFDQIYRSIENDGGLLFNSFLSLNVERVTAPDGTQTCQKVLNEMVDLVPVATCLIHEEKIVLEQLPLSVCAK